ncbi:molybdopterin-dependent oxidoreductase [Salinisphaera aquimarina]
MDGDRLTAVEADPGHPTGQATCAKGRAAPELVHSRERILYPMMRTGAKDAEDPGWQRISWDDALTRITDRLAHYRDRHGAESVAFSVTTPSGTPMSDSIDWVERFIRLYGSPNTIYATELCNWHKDHAHAFTFGCGMPVADYSRAHLNILWGHNPATVWLSQAGKLADQKSSERKALLVIDPRETAHARNADLWLRIRPGTDGALALGLANVLIERQAYDTQFIRRWTNAPLLVDDASGRFVRAEAITAGATGFLAWSAPAQHAVIVDTQQAIDAELSTQLALDGTHRIMLEGGGAISCRPAFEHYRKACAAWSVERTAAATGLAAAEIEQAADMLIAAGQAVSYHGWTGIGQHNNATQTERAIATLYALTGSFDRIGGNRIYGPLPWRRVNDLSLLDEGQRRKALGYEKRPLGPPASGWVTAGDVYDAILERKPYAVRALFGFGANFLVSQPDPERGEQALRSLEFHVHCDLFHTPTNAYADILLPINTPWEREGLRPGFEIDAEAAAHVQLRQRMVPPRGESRADYDVVMALACRLGMSAQFFDGDIVAGWNHMLAPLGLDIATLRAQPRGRRVALDSSECKYAKPTGDGNVVGFDTPTRRVEFYSEKLHAHDYPAVPQISLPTPNGSALPLTLMTAKDGYYCHSQHRQIGSLRRRSPCPRVAISPALAAQRGFEEDQWVAVSGPVGRARMRVHIDRALDDGVVVADYGWWQACDDLGLPGAPIHGPTSRNINAVFDATDRDPLSGAIALRSGACDLQAIDTNPHWPGFRPLRVAGVERETDDVVSIRLCATDGGALAGFQPGQHLPLRFEMTDGHRLERCYSLSGVASPAPEEYRISVKRLFSPSSDRPALVSHHVNNALKVGDHVWARMPAGRFTLPRCHSAPIVLIAGGIGITPFLSLLESLAYDGAATMPDIWLVYANRNSQQHPFRARIDALAEHLPRLTLINVYSKPLAHDRLGRDYVHAGRIDDTLIDPYWLSRRARFYLCGPGTMMTQLRERLLRHGVFAFEIFSETFAPPETADLSALEPRRIYLTRSDVTLTWTPDHGSILACAEHNGIELPSGCRAGQCESCALRLVAGRVHTDVALDALDSDTCLTCQAVPLSDIELDA